jgi:DNA-binding MarR family transcriptional regulator
MATLRRVRDQPTWMLSRANARAQRLLHEAFDREGLRGYHFRLLAALDEHGPGSQANLSRQTGIDRSDVVATLNQLVDGGLAERHTDPADRRRNVIAITDDGVETLQRLDVALSAVQEAVLEPLTARQRATFTTLLAKLG